MKRLLSKKSLRAFLYICAVPLLLVLSPSVFAQGASRTEPFPRIQADPLAQEFYQRGRADSGFSWVDLAEISVWASGSSGRDAATVLNQIHILANAVQAAPGFPATQKEQAEFILTYLHANVLRSYSLHQTRVDTAFANGRFNCVSSAVLYLIIGTSVGLDMSGVVTKEHAFVMVHLDGETVDVETTSALGFDPGNRREFHDEFGRVTGFAYVPAQNYRDRTTITPIELVSLIFSNRIVEQETRRRFADAVPLAVDSTALLTGSGGGTTNTTAASRQSPASFFEDPATFLLNRLFNFGASLLNAGKEEESLAWAAYASALYGGPQVWQEFNTAAVNNRIQRFIRGNQFAQAQDFLERHKPDVNPEDFARLDALLTDNTLLTQANQIRNRSDGDAAVTAITQARANGRIDDKRADELLIFAVHKTSRELSAAPARDWLQAIKYLEDATARFGTRREWEEALEAYRHNRAADYHNRFAAAWNRRNYDEARRILDEGLAEFPTNRQLLSNQETVNRQQSAR